ncbi:hypothetical protein K1719_038608 [Acacia pycnantha]|nr:hypothetical protein K1719_038608 [Acacia pycnantha]
MCFDGMTWVPNVGRSGGIVAVWKKAEVDISVLRSDQQFIHLRCCDVGSQISYITAIYALPCNNQKQILWAELGNLASCIRDPWVLIGDFNDVASAME